MNYQPAKIPNESSIGSVSHVEAKYQHDERIWKQLGEINVGEALSAWFETLPFHTKKNYMAGFRRLASMGFIDMGQNLQEFSLVNHESIVDRVKLVEEWSEATKQARAAAYISFTGFLQRRTRGILRKAVAKKEGVNKTFFKVREKVKTNFLSQSQTEGFMAALESINKRDCLIAKLILQGGKRKSEVLGLNRSDIDFENKRVHYRQTKTRGTEKITIVNYPEHIMDELSRYIGNRTHAVFITRNKKRIATNQIDRNFLKAGVKAGIHFRVTPHVLRVTLVTRLKELKVQDSDIMKITGHASPTQLLSYDKSDPADNASLHYHFV